MERNGEVFLIKVQCSFDTEETVIFPSKWVDNWTIRDLSPVEVYATEMLHRQCYVYNLIGQVPIIKKVAVSWPRSLRSFPIFYWFFTFPIIYCFFYLFWNILPYFGKCHIFMTLLTWNWHTIFCIDCHFMGSCHYFYYVLLIKGHDAVVCSPLPSTVKPCHSLLILTSWVNVSNFLPDGGCTQLSSKSLAVDSTDTWCPSALCAGRYTQ